MSEVKLCWHLPLVVSTGVILVGCGEQAFVTNFCCINKATTPSGEEGASWAQNMLVAQPTMIKVPVNMPLSEKLDLNGRNLMVKWQRFRRGWSNYEVAAQLKDPENPDRHKERRTATLLTCISPNALDVINAMVFDTEDKRKDLEIILAKMEKYCTGESIETCERYVFNWRDQEANESVDAYIRALRKVAKTSNNYYVAIPDLLIHGGWH